MEFIQCDSRAERDRRFLEFGLLKNSLVPGSGGVFPLLFLSPACLPCGSRALLLAVCCTESHYRERRLHITIEIHPLPFSLCPTPVPGLQECRDPIPAQSTRILSASDRHRDQITSETLVGICGRNRSVWIVEEL